jgi:prefoldin subunit 5
MKFFKRKEDNLLDLTEKYNEQMNSATNNEISANIEDRRAKLIKRLTNMTDKLEELSNQIYKLQQRIEVLERKANIRGE